MSLLNVNKIDPATGTGLELGTSGDTITVPSGAELKSNKISPASGTAFTLGDSGDTFTVPSGVTFANSGTATGFGSFECEEYDIWHLTTDFDGDATPIASNLARYATHFDKFGTGMSESSGVFTFPSTGKWLVSFRPQFYLSESGETDRYISGSIQLADGTNLTMGATSKTYISGGNTTTEIYMQTLIDVTNTSSITIRFCIDSTNSGVTVWGGGSANLNTNMQFFKLGAT